MNDKFNIDTIPCLSCEEAATRLKQEGFNEIVVSSTQHNFFMLIFNTIREPMFLLLLIGAILYFILGSKQEALLLLSFVLIIIGITIHQERKSERALNALRDLSSPRAFVIRGGKGMRIAGREVVRDDIIVVSEGDRIPADAVLLSSTNLLIDEAILTGESVPVRKTQAEDFLEITATSQPGGEDLPFIYSSTYVVQGKGMAKVLAIGQNTIIGKIGESLTKLEIEATPLQKETHSLVRNFAIWGFFFCILVAVIYGLTRNDWLHGFLAGISLAMAILPEEFPVVLTVFLALGAWRISLKHVLTRRVPAVEALGSATVLCADKTGTITQNRMSVKKLWTQEHFHEINAGIMSKPIPEEFHALVEFSILASQRDPFDPMEIAIKSLGNQYLKNTEHLHDNWSLAHQYPLTKELLAISLVWKSPTDKNYVIAAKGAPETIFDLCHLKKEQIEKISQQVQQMANDGLRVLGVAKANFVHQELPNGQHDFDFEFIGLIGLADPVRPNVFDAVQSCYQAGIRVIMITGDYVGTAQNIARQIGLKDVESFISGPELTSMNDLELQRRIKFTNIFARILPEQKLRIVNALKANGEIVAMTGDGVNDAPALKSAHIGIAMGKRGTDVARESSALVLLDDDFSSIVAAVRLGRRIFDNIKKAVSYLIAVHLPIIGMSLVPILLKWPLVLLPAHIVFLELIIDPTCSVVFEAEEEEKDVMKRSPRNPKEKLFNHTALIFSFFQGISIFGVVFAVFFITKYVGYDEQITRAMTFSTLVITNLALILANRSRSLSLLQTLCAKNKALWYVMGGALALLVAVLYLPFLQKLFYFNSLSLTNLGVCFAIGILTVFWLKKLN